MLKKCQSPIEKALLRAIFNKLPPGYSIVPQVPILGGKYRADFLVTNQSLFLIVECDGKKWHTRFKYQKEHDAIRDADCKQAGYKVIRFPGRRIYRDKEGCLNSILKILT